MGHLVPVGRPVINKGSQPVLMPSFLAVAACQPRTCCAGAAQRPLRVPILLRDPLGATDPQGKRVGGTRKLKIISRMTDSCGHIKTTIELVERPRRKKNGFGVTDTFGHARWSTTKSMGEARGEGSQSPHSVTNSFNGGIVMGPNELVKADFYSLVQRQVFLVEIIPLPPSHFKCFSYRLRAFGAGPSALDLRHQTFTHLGPCSHFKGSLLDPGLREEVFGSRAFGTKPSAEVLIPSLLPGLSLQSGSSGITPSSCRRWLPQ